MAGKLKIHISGIVMIILILLAGILVPQSQQILVYVSSFGFLALISILFVVSTPIIYRLKRNNFTAYILANRRWIGIYTFIFALIHVVLVFNFLFSWNIAMALENPYRMLGGISILILAAMTATSNDASMRKLGKNWKRLHNLVYVALILIVIHSTNIGKIFMQEAAIKWIIIIVTVVFIIWKVYGYSKTKTPQVKELPKKSIVVEVEVPQHGRAYSLATIN